MEDINKLENVTQHRVLNNILKNRLEYTYIGNLKYKKIIQT